MRLGSSGAFLLTLGLCAPSGVVAQDPAPEAAGQPGSAVETVSDDAEAAAQARALFALGVERIDRGDLQGAAAAFERAYALRPHHRVLYNLGKLYHRLGRSVEAFDALSAYLADSTREPDARTDAEIRGIQSTLEKELSWLSVRIQPSDAVVHVDGRLRGAAAELPRMTLLPGVHVLELGGEGLVPTRKEVALSAGQHVTVSEVLRPLTPTSEPVQPAAEPSTPLEPAPAPQPKPPERQPPTFEPSQQRGPSSGHSNRWALGTTIGAGVLGLGAVVVALWNEGRYGQWELEDAELQRILDQGPPFPNDAQARQRDNDRLLQEIQSADVATIAVGATAGALLIASTVLWLTGSSGDGDSSLSPSVSPGLAGARLRLRY